MIRVAAVAVCAVLLAGCGGGASPTPSTTADTTGSQTSTAAPATSTPTTTQTTGIDPLTGASDRPALHAAENKAVALLTAVRAARHEGYDRVVFVFANAVPGYDVRYVAGPVHADGSGAVVPVAGGNVVVVRMNNALDADLSQASAPRTYTGPNRFSPGTPEVSELVRVGGFEGVLTWAVGLVDHVDFRVTTLENPPRLVVDFRNH